MSRPKCAGKYNLLHAQSEATPNWGLNTRIIQVRPSRNPRWQKQGGWVAFEADGVSPVFCGQHGRADALSYAKQRAGYGRAEIQVLDEAGNVVETIGNEEARPLV